MRLPWLYDWRKAILGLALLSLPAISRPALIDVELSNLPVTDALDVVARQAGLELIVHDELRQAGKRPDGLPWEPPTLLLKLKQVEARQVMESLVGAYGLAVDRSGLNLRKLRFARGEELIFQRAPRPLPDPGQDKPKAGLLFFDEAPLLQVIQTLALQSRLNLVLSHELGVGKTAQGTSWREVLVTFKIRNATPQQALEAVLDASGLTADWSSLGQVGTIYPMERFAPAGEMKKSPVPPPVEVEKTDFILTDLPLEDFIKLVATQMNVNWMISPAAQEATTGPEKQRVMQSGVSISQKGVTPFTALQEVLKSKGLEFRWNSRAEIGVVDLTPRR